MKYVKQQILHDRKIGDRQLIIKGDGTIELNPGSGTVEINGDLKVTGSSSGPTDTLIYYVSLQGSDENDGLGQGPDRAKRTVKSAVEAAPAGSTIKVAPGDYYEDNPITLKERMTVRGDSLRNCQIWPLNNTETIFYMDCACYLFQLTFRGLADPGWCAEIRPGALVTVSPYVQNCTNMNGPWLNDGTEFVPFQTEQIPGVPAGARPIIDDPNVPLEKRVNDNGGGNGMKVDGAAYDQRSLVRSFVADAFTQVAQGGIGFWLLNEGYTQIVSCFSVFTRVGFQATAGGYLSISNSVSDFGTYAIIADGLFEKVFTTARPTQDYYSVVGSVTINNQGAGYTNAPSVTIDPPTTPGGVQATGNASIDPATGKVVAVSISNQGSGYDFIPNITFTGGGFSVPATGTVNLITNRIVEVDSLRDIPQTGSIITFEGDETRYYVTSSEITTRPFIYDETICRRDIQRIIDAVSGDSALGTNYQSINAGRSYLRATSQKVLNQQLAPTIYGIEAARDEMLKCVPDTDPANIDYRYNIIENFAIITNTITQGDSTAVPDVVYNELTNIDSGVIAAKDNIVQNKDFIIDEVVNYISDQFTDLSYDQDKCERDVRQITTAVAYDTALGTNYSSVTAGRAYARANASVVYQKQKVQTIAAYQYLKTLMLALPNVVASSTATSRVNNAMDEIIEILSRGDSTSADDYTYPSPTGVIAARENARDQLVNNKDFIQEEIVKWVDENYPSLDYDQDACYKDVGHIVDGLVYDILYGGNYATRDVAQAYFVGTASQLGSDETTATIAAYGRLKEITTQILQGDPVFRSTGNLLVQDTSAANATGVEAERADDYIDIIIEVINTGALTNLPEVQYPSVIWAAADVQAARSSLFAAQDNFATNITSYLLTTYPNFTYDRTKCKRDVELILDAVVRDVKLGTNHNSIQAGQAYQRATATYFDVAQKPATIISIRYLKTLAAAGAAGSSVAVERVNDRFDIILNLIEFADQTLTTVPDGGFGAQTALPSEGRTFPAPTPASQELIDANRLLQANRDFLVEDTIKYIANNYFVYDSAKCARDTALILDAVTYDLVLGTNYNSVQAGLAYYNANASLVISDQLTETVAAITYLRTEVATLVAADSASVTACNDLFDEIIDILQNGVLSADPLTFTDPGSDVNKAYARTLLQSNRTFIISELIAWINLSFPTLVYDQAKCERDTGYIIDAVSHDIQYGTNFATRTAALAYFEGTASQIPASQKDETIAAYQQLIDIADDIIIENRAGQTLTGNPASSAEMDELAGLVTYIVDVLQEESTENLPSLYEPDLTWVASNLTNSRDLILASGDSSQSDLVQSVIDYINTSLNGLSYDEAKCRRDSEYIIDSVSHDMLYGGNRSILVSTRAYFDDGVSTIVGQEFQTADAIEHLRDISVSIIEGVPIAVQPGNGETQDLSGTFGTSTESEVANDLYNILILAITDSLGLGTTPQNTDPDYSWISSSLVEAADNVLTNSTTYQQQVIDYITQNIIGFRYNVEKCKRDTNYIIDAAVYDMMYGGNKQTRRAAEAYYSGTILSAASEGNADQQDITEFTYKHLARVLSDVAQNIDITPSGTPTLLQETDGTNGSAAAGLILKTLVSKIAEVIETTVIAETGNTVYLPIEQDHNYAGLASMADYADRQLIMFKAQDIEDEAIRLLNLEYGGVAELTLFPGVLSVTKGTLGNMQRVSTVSTSGHAFEYVGAGITYNALPFFGGSPIAENEIVESNTGKVFAGGTVDQIGNFRVGNFFAVNALTGAITLNANQIDLTGIASIGPFQRFGIPVGVELKEVSDNTNLIASTGTADINTVPTQNAVVQFLSNNYLNKITGGTVEGDVTFELDIAVDGGDLTTTASEFNLVNDNANTVNFAGGAANINIGDLIGTTTINNSLVVKDDIKLGENPTTNVTTDSLTVNLLNTTVTTVNAMGEATTIVIGADTGTLTINNDFVIIDSDKSIQVPVGDTSARPSVPVIGQVRFNTDLQFYEGYNGVNWSSLVGTIDADQDTFIRPETGPGTDEDTLEFYADGSKRMYLNASELDVDESVDITINSDTQSRSTESGAVVVTGGMGIGGNLYVGGTIGGDIQIGHLGTSTLTIRGETVYAPDTIRLITDAPDSAADDIVYPLTLAHHTTTGAITSGAGTGMKFELETFLNNFETAAQVDVVSTDVTGGGEDFDMIISTMHNGLLTEKFRISELNSTFTTNLVVDGILDAAGFTGSIFADDSTEIIDAVNNKITVVNADIGTLILTSDLEVQYGGTGVSTFTENGILYGNTADPVQVTDAAGTADASNSFQILTVTSDADATPVWTDTIDGGTF